MYIKNLFIGYTNDAGNLICFTLKLSQVTTCFFLKKKKANYKVIKLPIIFVLNEANISHEN